VKLEEIAHSCPVSELPANLQRIAAAVIPETPKALSGIVTN